MTRTKVGEIVRVALLGAALAAGGCSDDGGAGGSGTGGASSATESECKGGKNAPFADPSGARYELPAGVVLEGEITGDFMPNCMDQPPLEYGGDLLIVCMSLRNTTGSDVTVRLPAGLYFLSEKPETQHGIILQDHEIVVPAGEVKHVRINLFCANKACEYGDTEDRFTFGPVNTHPGIAEIIGLVRGKKLDMDTAAPVVEAVWAVTDGDGLTDALRAQLSALPAAS